MANEKRVRNNNVQGTLSSTLNSTGTTMNSAGLANLEAISSTEHAAICIDPGRTNGAPEIVHVTAHTGSATSATISRGEEGTSARAHSSTEEWVHAPTATIDYLPFRPPTVRVRLDATQSFNNNGWEAIAFDTESWDSDTMWSSTDAVKVHCNTVGKYLAALHVGLAASSAGTIRGIAISKNSTSVTGTDECAQNTIYAEFLNGRPVLAVSQMFSLTTSDFLAAQVFQDSGAGLNNSTFNSEQPTFSVLWVSS